MKCLFCKADVKSWEKPGQMHLVITKDLEEQHIHVHGNIGDRMLCKELLHAGANECGLSLADTKLEKNEFVFHNRQRIGDMLVFTCAIRDFKAAFPDKRVNVISTASHIWDNNPYIDRTLKATDENTVKIGPSKLTNSSNKLDWHFANAFRVSIEEALDIHIPQGESRPDIWLTQEEWDSPNQFGRPYWLIVLTGEKGWGCKMYPFDRWQEFVNQNPNQLFVQLGAREDNPPRLQGENVIDFVGKTQEKETGIRDLFKLFLNAEGSIGLVSFHMHLSAALYKPCVVVAGAREPVSFTRYAGHQYLANDGCLPCSVNACWHCDINKCSQLIDHNGEKIPKCVDMIKPEDLTHALNQYYVGGRLQKGKICDRPKQFKNIIKPKESKPVVPAEEKKEEMDLSFGNDKSAKISRKDWDFIERNLRHFKPKTLLEFGAGLSTLLLHQKNVKVTTYETQQEWIDKMKSFIPELDIRLWDGVNLKLDQKFDMAFVDGPAGGDRREFATKIAAENCDVVMTHDSTYPEEQVWAIKYLRQKFGEPIKYPGSRHLFLWVKKPEIILKADQPSVTIPEGKKFIKVISTARGWGGCARSVTTIMKLLLKEGHMVEFIPFRNKVSSKEYQACIKDELQGLKVTENYDTLSEPCDVMLVYADDFVWEFGSLEMRNIFANIYPKYKVMMLNYRRGNVGEIPWTQGWDKYMFLNSHQEKELLRFQPNAVTKVLPPCTDLSEFFKVQINYNSALRIVRHSSQGDTKFDKEREPDLITRALEARPDLTITMLPGPTFIEQTERFKKAPRTSEPKDIASFLATGSLFWYSLPDGYMDMGPRVILEAMASGLPILADNWGGAPDRVTSDCGWICSKEEQLEVIKNVTAEELQGKGMNARNRALAEFRPERWLEELLI